MIQEDLLKVFKILPDLTPDGACIPWPECREFTREQCELKAREGQQSLLRQIDLMFRVCEFISINFEPIKTVNKNYSSYGLKHLVSDITGEYMANGVFIAAAVHCGFAFDAKNKKNPNFGISTKSIRNLCKKSKCEKWFG